jgi:hypothetical protein
MIVEVTFWIAVVVATRKLGKVYAKSGDVLYGSYISDNLARRLPEIALYPEDHNRIAVCLGLSHHQVLDPSLR